ncbi:MAG: response regulator [Candidatus Delongbacteria bacterium]|nr:response regulator [Candidatus Delongbacteria bacterium]
MKISQKLSLGFFIAVLSIWIAIYISFGSLRNVHNEYLNIHNDIIPGTLAMSEMDVSTHEAAHMLTDYINSRDKNYLEQVKATVEYIKKQGYEHQQHEMHLGAKEELAAKKLILNINRFTEAIENVLELVESKKATDQILKHEVELIHPVLDELSKQLKHHKSIHLAELNAAQKILHEVHSSGEKFLIYAGIIISLLSIIISYLISRSIVKPISKLRYGVERIGNGDLDFQVGTNSKDEIGELSRAFDDMTIELKASTTSIDKLNKEIIEREHAEKALRENEEKLARARKMESLGLLAGGVAHDLNNVLSGVVSYPELLLMKLPKDHEMRKHLELIHKSGLNASAIVNDLITIGRGIAIAKVPLNLNNVIENYLDSSEFKRIKQLHSMVSVNTSLNEDLMNINGSEIHLRKVVMNLLLNAIESIEGDGKVFISTMNCYLDKPLRAYDNINIGEYVILTVADNGPGIPAVDLDRIFEPFYTKKLMGRSGTGLGLSIVWNVVQDLKGYIDIQSTSGGTSFDLYFPVCRKDIIEGDKIFNIDDYKGNGESILIIDDMENQREITSHILEAFDYKVHSVPSGEDAIEYLKENSVDLLILDMIMEKGMNGRETYEEIIKIHPVQKAVIVSGYAETEEVKKAQDLGAGRFVKKPLSLENIGQAVKEELAK